MQSFTIHSINKKLKLKDGIKDLEGFKYKIKSSKSGVNEINITSPNIIDELIFANFNKKYKKILGYYLALLQDADDASDGDFLIVLDEIARLKSILIKKYNLVVRKQTEAKMLKKLKIIESEIKNKIINLKFIKEQEVAYTINEKKGKSR